MSRYKPYPKYKDSGIEWLGDVPVHWGITKLKRKFSVKLGKMLQPIPKRNTDILRPYVRAQNIQPFGIDISNVKEMWFTPEEIKELRLCKGDLLVSEGGDVGRSAIWMDEIPEAYFQNSINRVRPIEKDSNTFLYYFLSSIKHSGVIDIICNRLSIAHLTAEKLNDIDVVLPSISEQSAIATYLNHQTTQIDRLIEKKEQFIKLLQEKRQALITAAVTGKFDVRTGKPYPKYKPSGIEWLGDVPVHWEIRRLKDVGVLVAGSGFPHEYQNVQGEELYFYKVSDLSLSVDGKYLGKTKHTISRKIASKLGAKIIPSGAIVYAKIGAALFLNRRRITSSSCCIDNNMSAYIPNKLYISSEWAFRWLCIIDFNEHVNPGAVPSFGESYQAVLPIYVPPKDEQVLIERFLNHQTTQIDRLIEKTRKSIELLKEKRTALITAAVTGKIDVRDWKPEAA